MQMNVLVFYVKIQGMHIAHTNIEAVRNFVIGLIIQPMMWTMLWKSWEKKKEIVKEYEKYHYSVRLDDAIDIVKRGGVE